MDFSIYIKYVFGLFINLIQSFKSVLEKNKILIVVLIVMFIVIGIVFYRKYIFPKINKTYANNKEFVSKNKNDDNNTTLYFFYTNWCPKCKIAQTEWNAFKSDTGGDFNGIKLTFKEVDCDVETDVADKFKIVGYPTIKLVYKDKIYEYDAKTDRELLSIFLGDIFKNP